MPSVLWKIPFTATLLPLVQTFSCGDQPWEREMSAWIRNDGPDGMLADMQARGTEVWLYATDSGEFVGFGRVMLNLIPISASNNAFKGSPPMRHGMSGSPRRFSII